MINLQNTQIPGVLYTLLYIRALSVVGEDKKRRVSYLYRTATTSYPCYIPVLGDFRGSWSYKTYPLQKYGLFPNWQAKTEKFYSCP